MDEHIWSGLHNSVKGTCLLIANGPGLNDIPLEFLQKYPSFGTNNIFLKEGLTTTYYVVTNLNVVKQSRKNIIEYPASIKFSKDLTLQNFVHYSDFNKDLFTRNPAYGINEGHTVTHVCLQIAYWMGFTTVLIVGLDHKYNDTGTPNKRVVKTSEDTDHFCKEYFPPGTVWQYPDLLQSEKAYKIALENYQAAWRKIINISTVSACTIFPREHWKKYA